MESNSVGDGNFFETIYSGCEIEKVKARRSINSDSSKRGEVEEIIIRNYREK